MALQGAPRLIGITVSTLFFLLLTISLPVPFALALTAFNASIYDVPGGYRAVMFDRFRGVKAEVCDNC